MFAATKAAKAWGGGDPEGYLLAVRADRFEEAKAGRMHPATHVCGELISIVPQWRPVDLAGIQVLR